MADVRKRRGATDVASSESQREILVMKKRNILPWLVANPLALCLIFFLTTCELVLLEEMHRHLGRDISKPEPEWLDPSLPTVALRKRRLSTSPSENSQKEVLLSPDSSAYLSLRQLPIVYLSLSEISPSKGSPSDPSQSAKKEDGHKAKRWSGKPGPGMPRAHVFRNKPVPKKDNHKQQGPNYLLYADNPDVMKTMITPTGLLPEPLQIMKEYISQHGSDVQPKHGLLDDRKYMVFEYRCPDRAGNFIGSALNQIVLAMLSNRTLIFRSSFLFSPNPFKVKEELTCNRILDRADWIAQNDIVYRPYVHPWYQREVSTAACAKLYNLTEDVFWECAEKLENAPVGTGALFAENVQEHRIIDMRGVTGCVHSEIPGYRGRFDLRIRTCNELVRATVGEEDMIDQKRIDMLYKYGVDYLYGMVFRHAFKMTDKMMQSVETTGGTFDPDAFSIGLHTRHQIAENDGSNVDNEIACLDKILSNRDSDSQKKKCQLLIMSDREKTNEKLTAYAKEKGCEGITATQKRTVTAKGYRHDIRTKEHGPFAGTGYWRDMAIVTKAHNGFVATTRSSSGLLQNVMVYDRTMARLAMNGGGAHAGEKSLVERHGLDICYHSYEGPERPDWPTSS